MVTAHGLRALQVVWIPCQPALGRTDNFMSKGEGALFVALSYNCQTVHEPRMYRCLRVSNWLHRDPYGFVYHSFTHSSLILSFSSFVTLSFTHHFCILQSSSFHHSLLCLLYNLPHVALRRYLRIRSHTSSNSYSYSLGRCTSS